MHYEYYSAPSGLLGNQWRWRLVAGNGKTVASGESYYNLADCLHAIDLLKSTTVLTPVKQTIA